jgi:hypothetical protein
MILTKRLKTFFLTLVLILTAGNLFAVEEYVSKVYKEIDIIFVKQADKELANILRENVDDKYYYLMENYTKKKVRRLIIDNEYEFAMTAIYIIIDNNIDGDFEDEDAVDLYAAVAEAYEIQQQFEKEKEQKALAEAQKKAAEKERLLSVVEKDYNVVTTAEGKTVYLSSKDERTEKYRWNLNFGMIDFGLVTAAGLEKPSMAEGIALDFTYEYAIPKSVAIGGDLFFDFKFMQFNKGPMEFNFEIAPKVAFPFAPKLFFRIGFSDLGVLKNDTEANTGTGTTKPKISPETIKIQNALYGSVISPFVGVQLSNALIGSASLNLDLNYLLGGIIAGDYQALSLKAGVSVPFAELERVKLVFNLGARDTLLIKAQDGIENHASIILGFGVENVIR